RCPRASRWTRWAAWSARRSASRTASAGSGSSAPVAAAAARARARSGLAAPASSARAVAARAAATDAAARGGRRRTVARRGPGVRMAKATVAGSIDKDLIRRVVRSHVGEVRKCYEDGLSRDPNLKGRVAIQFTIGKSGKVTVSVVAESTLTDDAVGECIARA